MFVPKSLLFKISEAKKLNGVQCCAYSCSNKPHPKKKGLCHKHWGRYIRIKDPVYARFQDFRKNALKRGKQFDITLQEFRDFCQRTGYIIKKGIRGQRATVDRINNAEGYHIDNIQLLTNRANVAKYNGVDRHITELPKEHEDFVPF